MASPASSPAVERFEEEFARLRKRQRIQLFGFAIVFLLLVHAAAEVSNFRLDRLLAGLPRIGEYIGKTLPEIRLATLFGDIAYWYYGFLKWLQLLFDTHPHRADGDVVRRDRRLSGLLSGLAQPGRQRLDRTSFFAVLPRSRAPCRKSSMR